MWRELGIKRTKDAKAIRRAYAVKLRTLDPDADPAAFQRLRDAYTRAIAYSQIPDRALATVEVEIDGETHDIAISGENAETEEETGDEPELPLHEPSEEEREYMAFEAALDSALEAGDVRGALRLVTTASVKGTIALGAREWVMARIMPVAVKDRSLTAREYLDILEQSGWVRRRRGAMVPHFQADAFARADAERWYLALQAAAARSNWTWRPIRDGFLKAYFQSRAARLLVEGQQFIRLSKTGAAPLERYVEDFSRHEKWLTDRISPARIRHAEFAVRFGKGASELLWVGLVLAGIGLVLGAITLGIGSTGSGTPVIGLVWIVIWAFRWLARSNR